MNRLHDLQEEDGLHAANKMTDKHVYFENHKMRVNLAALRVSGSPDNEGYLLLSV